MSSSGLTTSETIEAGDKNGINLILSETKTPITRVNIEIRDYITGKNYASLKGISVNQNRLQILPSSIDTLIKRAGKYTISLESGELA